MKNSRIISSLLLSTLWVAQVSLAQQPQVAPVSAPNNAPQMAAPNQQVAMIMLRVEHNKGRDYIITPRGYKAQVPGKGIGQSAKSVAVYQDAQQNYWYIDKHGEPTPVRPEVVQSVMAQVSAQSQQNAQLQAGSPLAAGMAGTAGGAPVQQTTIIQQPASGGTSGGSGAMGAATMAMSGTALGMSIGALANSSHNSYYGVPYGKPLYQDNHHYYYNNDSKKVYVAPNNYNKQYFDQWNKQGNWNDRQNWSKNVQPITQNANRYDRRGGRFRR
jgi:hypothetical protein